MTIPTPSVDAEFSPTEPQVLHDIALDTNEVLDVVIIGGGISGLSAGIYAARAGMRTVVLQGEFISMNEMPGGQLMLTPEIENYPGFAGGSGSELIDTIQTQAQKFGAEIIDEGAVAYEFGEDGAPHIVRTAESSYQTKTIILATGAVARRLGVTGEDEFFGYGVSVCATCDGAFFGDVPVAVVGGGDSAVEDALFLTEYASKVYLIHRRDTLRTTSPQARALLQHPKVEIVWNSTVDHIKGADKKVHGVVLHDGSVLDVNGVFVAIGHDPAVKHLQGTVVGLNDGNYIVTSQPTTHTNVPGVFAAGDVVDDIYRQAITAAGSGAKAAMDAHRWLLEH